MNCQREEWDEKKGTYAVRDVVGVHNNETANVQRVVADQVHRIPPELSVSDTAGGVVDGDDGMVVTVDEGELARISSSLVDVVDVA